MTPEELFTSHEIRSLTLAPDTDIRDAEASRVELDFADGYRVSFKLLEGPAVNVYRWLEAIGPPPDCPVTLTPRGHELSPDQCGETVRKLIASISGRVAKIHREQKILNTQPLGKSFLLHGRTRFEVLEDNGKGQLTIRIQRDGNSSEAGLAASDLLDGLHAGVITPA